MTETVGLYPTARVGPPVEEALSRPAQTAPAPRTSSVGAKPVAIHYLGFHDVSGRRQYALRARRGDREGHYSLSIDLAAFANRRALLQDGPAICYQKLLHELADAELRATCDIVVTDSDLAAYRESHSVPARGRSSRPRPGEPAKA